MLSPSDAEIVRRDRGIPGLGILLDDDAFTETLRSAFPDVTISSSRCRYLRYKPGTSCLAAYQVELDADPVEVHAQAFDQNSDIKTTKAAQHVDVRGSLGAGVVVLDRPSLAISVFPNDRRIESLSEVAETQSLSALLRRLLPEQPEFWGATVSPLRYKPQRRFVGQLSVDGMPRAVLRFYTASGYQRAIESSKGLTSRGSLRLARRLGRSDHHRMIAFEWLPGETPGTMAGAETNHERIGAALGEFHQQHLKHGRQRDRVTEIETLQAVAEGLEFLRPDLAPLLRTVVANIAERLITFPFARGLIHGDFHPDQVLLGDGTVAILDLDHVTHGDPAVDLGNFLAHLEYHSPDKPIRIAAIRDGLLSGYESEAARVPSDQIALQTAASLIRLAPHPFRNREPDWPSRTERLLARAAAIMDELSARSSVGFCASGVTVQETSSVTADSKLSFLGEALDPLNAQRSILESLGADSPLGLNGIRVTRHKPGRRCLVEYDFACPLSVDHSGMLTVLGKARAKGLDRRSFHLAQALRQSGFHENSPDGVSVPEPLGMIAKWNMWLQRKVTGTAGFAPLCGEGGIAVAARTAEALHKLHRAGIPSRRRHPLDDEMRILHDRLAKVTAQEPSWAPRITRLLVACDQLASRIPAARERGIHRDFYPDQVLISGKRVYLLDLDLYCLGDPALDVGNFSAHLIEYALRNAGGVESLTEQQQAFETRFLELSPETSAESISAYTTLTLARHVYISTKFAARRPHTETLLKLCERRLGAAD